MFADQVKQQVQRPFKGLQINFQRIGRDIEILRDGIELLAIDTNVNCELGLHQ